MVFRLFKKRIFIRGWFTLIFMEPILHLFLPVAILLIIFPVLDKLLLLKLWPLTFIMDFDLFIYPELHRALFHNFLFLILVSLVVLYYFGKTGFYISLFYLFSHLLFDSAIVGNALFWPFSDYLFGFNFEILKFPSFSFNLKWIYMPLSSVISGGKVCYLCSQGSLIVVLLIVALIIKFFYWRK